MKCVVKLGGYMNKDLEQVIKSVSNLIQIKSSIMTVGSYFQCVPCSQEEKASITKYALHSLEELIHFSRIEKMYDLSVIDSNRKEELYRDYKEYQELRFIISSYLGKKILNEYDNEEEMTDISVDASLKERCKYLEDKLTSCGVITDFDYEEAIMNQVDKEINQRIKIKKKK